MRRISAEFIAVRPGLSLGRLAPFSLQAVARYGLIGGTVTAFDATLERTRIRQIEVSSNARLLAATPDLRVLAVAESDSLVLFTDKGASRRLPIQGADSATWLPSGRLLVTAPGVVPARADRSAGVHGLAADRVEIQYASWHDKYQALLVDPHAGRILDQAVLDTLFVDHDGVDAIAHPHDGSVLLDVAGGQDGGELFIARECGGRLKIDVDGGLVAGFNARGDRLLGLPYPGIVDEAVVVTWPDQELVGTLTVADLNGVDGEINFDCYGCFLNGDQVLMLICELGQLVLCSPDLRLSAWVDLHVPSMGDDIEPVALYGLTPNAFAVDLRRAEQATTTIWRLPAI